MVYSDIRQLTVLVLVLILSNVVVCQVVRLCVLRGRHNYRVAMLMLY